MLIMQNNINIKIEKEESEGVGLQNIKNRYHLLTNKAIIQEKNNEIFIVKLPIIHYN
jgi:two-component system, LytTR family, sensor kinase